MRYYSTRNRNESASFAKAALTGLAPDGGLYVPELIPSYTNAVLSSLGSMRYTDIAYETIRPWVKDDIPDSALMDMLVTAYPFSAELADVGDRHVLELFHGPSAAFKDFGARFMAQSFSYLRRGEDKELKILVATSGDTGGAVAEGFFCMEGISVTVLYPKGKVTPLQEKQIAGLGQNVSAIAVEGSFDDCQRLVKEAFGDAELTKKFVLSSANSINISRLIPQAVYYSYAAGVLNEKKGRPLVCVPSGNFGNLTAGLYAWKMGAPIERFVAATNINKTVPDFLESGFYETRPSQVTLSNAMDVGAPSNFERMTAHFSWGEMRRLILGSSVNDEETRRTIKEVYSGFGYCLDPHSAVGWNAVDKLREAGTIPGADSPPTVILSTAHPAKFAETVEPLVGAVPLPASLQKVSARTVNSVSIPTTLEALKNCLRS